MRNLLLIVLLLSTMIGYAEGYDIRGSKSGGKIVKVGLEYYIGYDDVEYEVNNEGKKVTFICEGKGNNPCRGNVGGVLTDFVTSKGNTFSYDKYMDVINSLIDQMDKMYFEEQYSGRYTKQISAVSKEGNRCTLVFGITWTLDKEGNGDFFIKIDELDFFNF